MLIETTRFGSLEVPDDAVIRFPHGLLGLNGASRYCLLQHGEQSPFLWLQAADAPGIAMVVTDPFEFFPGYEVELSDEEAELLEAREPADVTIYSTVTVGGARDNVCANLLGPLAINHKSGLGMQLILDGNRYSTRHRIGEALATPGAAA